MLKALELVGFKSFADRTRFEFPDGITVVVGPNGSGKSNIVDAIKWTLGEQSAKSLRGKEMADVIFKGSGTGLRKPANTAEATIFFDNSQGRLDIESEEVSVTRRVYRSGEGEYLINGQPCRMRDVKDLFRGTGVGTDAYSLIEQGKVDTLLQASARDRRAIFEEAAGISRFKAKKIECQRRLDRVEQNLVRLSDIVEEVSGRLRTLKSQATKAQRYREYTDRLKQLRTNVGLADWRQLTSQIESLTAEMTEIDRRKAELQSELSSAEARVAQLDKQHQELSEQMVACDEKLANLRAENVRQESNASHLRSRVNDAEEEAARYRIELNTVTAKADIAETQLQETKQELEQAKRQYAQVAERHREQESAFESVSKELDGLRSAAEKRRRELAAEERKGAGLENQLGSLKSELASALTQIERSQSKISEIKSLQSNVGSQLSELEKKKSEIEKTQEKSQQDQDQLENQIKQDRESVEAAQHELSELQAKQQAAQEREDILDELEKRLDGIGAGVKDLLEKSKSGGSDAFAEVLGMVADMLEVDLEFAPLVDVALGPLAKQVVVDGETLFDEIASTRYKPPGRVGLILLKQVTVVRTDHREIATETGVIGPATRFVKTDGRFDSLLQRLLGTTWFVDSIRDAKRLRSKGWLDARFVTKAGELLDADGSITVGPRVSSDGILSRRTELRDVRSRIEAHAREIETRSQNVAGIRTRIKESEAKLKGFARQQRELGRQRSELVAQVLNAQQRQQDLVRLYDEADTEATNLKQQRAASQNQLTSIEGLLTASLAAAKVLHDAFDTDNRRASELQKKNKVKARQLTETKVELASSEQRRTTLETQLRRFEQDHEDRDKSLKQAQRQLELSLTRTTESSREILGITSRLAEGYLAQERFQAERKQLLSTQSELQSERGQVATRIADVRRQLQDAEGERHRRELRSDHLLQERVNLESRLRDDYQIELSSLKLDAASEEEQQQRDEVDSEISTLRRKISNIGAVNMEALTELEELENRYGTLSTQYEDLIKSKESLAKIIQRINGDSRRLFGETLEQIRTNFQNLFRRVFGGGSADIVLEPDVDILEAGIDIVATPPGKHSLGISLLSGGERALTAVTLLLAIFEFSPSPFCVLDEVDGPLDEANIGRFIDVLNEFLKWTKFVVVTHSKTTMTCANTLYGVTMQESGVSKRVSVQFDDVGEDGHIREEAIKRPEKPPAEDKPKDRGAA